MKIKDFINERYLEMVQEQVYDKVKSLLHERAYELGRLTHDSIIPLGSERTISDVYNQVNELAVKSYERKNFLEIDIDTLNTEIQNELEKIIRGAVREWFSKNGGKIK